MSDPATSPPGFNSPDKAPWPRRLSGAALSLLVGLGTVTMVFCWEPLSSANYSDFIGRFSSMLLRATRIAMLSGLLAGPGALFFLFAYLAAPRHSIIWKWPMATFCGALVGAALGAAWSPFIWSDWFLELALLGAIGGAATGLCAAMTARWFCDPRPPDESGAS